MIFFNDIYDRYMSKFFTFWAIYENFYFRKFGIYRSKYHIKYWYFHISVNILYNRPIYRDIFHSNMLPYIGRYKTITLSVNISPKLKSLKYYIYGSIYAACLITTDIKTYILPKSTPSWPNPISTSRLLVELAAFIRKIFSKELVISFGNCLKNYGYREWNGRTTLKLAYRSHRLQYSHLHEFGASFEMA